MDLKNPRQNSANFSHNQNCANLSTQKNVNKKKFLKIFGAGTLAIMMGIGTLCGVLLAPISGSAASSITSQDTPATNLPAEAQAKAELDANILAGGDLGLDPENDPVIATTDWGLDIKFHNALGSYAGVSTSALSGYVYFSMGTYSGTTVNWVVIGHATNVAQRVYYNGSYASLGSKYGTYTAADYINHTTLTQAAYYKNNIRETASPAGSAISGDASKELVHDFANVLFANSVANAEISSGCVLCISEKVLGTVIFNGTGDTDDIVYYNDSVAKTTMDNFYTSTLGLTSTQKSYIIKQTLKSYTGWYSDTCSTQTQYFFAPAYSTSWEGAKEQNFCIQTYLTSNARRVSYTIGTTTAAEYVLRTGGQLISGSWKARLNATSVSTTGSTQTARSIAGTYGLRPMAVIKL